MSTELPERNIFDENNYSMMYLTAPGGEESVGGGSLIARLFMTRMALGVSSTRFIVTEAGGFAVLNSVGTAILISLWFASFASFINC